MNLTDQDKTQLQDLQPVQEVLRTLVIALGALNVAAMPKVGYMLRAGAASEDLTPVARTMLADLAEGIEMLTSGPSGH